MNLPEAHIVLKNKLGQSLFKDRCLTIYITRTEISCVSITHKTHILSEIKTYSFSKNKAYSIIQSILKQEVIQQSKSYKTLNLIFGLGENHLFPEKMLNPKDLNSIFELINPNTPKDKALYFNTLHSFYISNVFAIDKALIINKERIGECTIFHDTSLHIYYHLNHFYTKQEQSVSVMFRGSSFHIVTSKKRQVLADSQHHFETIDELCYFLLLSLKKLNIKPEETSILALGDITKTCLHTTILKTFIKEIQFATPPEEVDFGKMNPNVLSKYILALTCATCEL